MVGLILSMVFLSYIGPPKKTVYLMKPGHKKSHITSEIKTLFSHFHGQTGLYVHNLKTGEVIDINADSLFPTASMIKVPIMVRLYDLMNQGTYSYDQKFTYNGRYDYPYEPDLINTSKLGTEIPLRSLIHIMISMSDNSAALWCQHLDGGGIEINKWLASHGFKYLRINSRTPSRVAEYKEYGWGVTTPREMAELVTRIYKGEVVSKAASDQMYRTLSRSMWDGEALSQIPNDVNAASKQGEVDAAKSEVVLINAPHGDYVFCIATKNQEDTRWTYDNEGYVLIRKVSYLLWQHFESKSKWKPDPDLKKYW